MEERGRGVLSRDTPFAFQIGPLRSTRIALKNDGTGPLGVTFTFSKPGLEQLMRENSVLEEQPVTTLSADERAKIQARNRWHTVREK